MSDTPEAGAPAPDERAKAMRDARAKALLKPIYRFNVAWRAPDGQMLVGPFAHKAPTIGEQMRIDQAFGRHLAEAGGRLQPAAIELAAMITNLEVTLVERPHWARDLRAMTYLEPLYAVAKEASDHCATFCDPQGGADAGGELAGKLPRASAPVVEPALQEAP